MLKKMLYPVGKCHARYGSYIAWSFISTVIVSVESALASHSMLAVLGQQSELHRTFNYVGKDIVGQIGALGYISKTSFKADKEPYKFLQYSHIVQQISYVSMFCTPLASSLFLPIAGCSNILTNISFAGRYYEPIDKDIKLQDVIESGFVDRDKSYCIDANYWKGGNLTQYFQKRRRQLVFADDTMTDYRKLTPLECERLQTVPEGYTDHVSNTQRYKMLGNGWTVDVISHIFNGMKETNNANT